MSVEVVLPQFGMGMAEGTLTKWLVENGGAVKEGEPLYEIETEKSSQEVEAPASGVLKVIAEPGQAYEVGAVLAEIE